MKEMNKRELECFYAMKRSVGVEVFLARITVGFGVERVARAMGVKSTTISRVEAGIELPSLGFLFLFANAIGADLRMPVISFVAHDPSKVPRGGKNFKGLKQKNAAKK